jgi:hypothetical protein
MEWFGVEVADILSAEWLALPEAPRAHWLSLHAYCALHENGGVIRGAARWRDREWSFAAGLRLRSVSTLLDLGLLRSSEVCQEDYVLANYDSRGEERSQATSRIKSNAAKTRWQRYADARAGADAQTALSNARDVRDETRRDDQSVAASAPPAAPLLPFEPRWKPDFEVLYHGYPLKKGKQKGIASCERQIRTPADYEALRRAIANYAAEVRGKDPQYVKHFSTFMGCWRDYLEVHVGAAPVDELMEGHATGRLR